MPLFNTKKSLGCQKKGEEKVWCEEFQPSQKSFFFPRLYEFQELLKGNMKEVNRKQIGRIGLSMAINYFTINGYTVSLPINDTQWYDLIVEKDGLFESVQCKATQTKEDYISLCSAGGTKGLRYDSVLNHTELKWLFCVSRELGMWLIPVKDITTKRQIKLSKIPFKNRGFQTYNYFVGMGR